MDQNAPNARLHQKSKGHQKSLESNGLSWFIMVYHGFYHVFCWYIMVYDGLSWFILVYNCLSWFIMVYHGLSWFIMNYHELSWFIIIFPSKMMQPWASLKNPGSLISHPRLSLSACASRCPEQVDPKKLQLEEKTMDQLDPCFLCSKHEFFLLFSSPLSIHPLKNLH
jgi:hypothetical protein